jgi:hypothetical protein
VEYTKINIIAFSEMKKQFGEFCSDLLLQLVLTLAGTKQHTAGTPATSAVIATRIRSWQITSMTITTRYYTLQC